MTDESKAPESLVIETTVTSQSVETKTLATRYEWTPNWNINIKGWYEERRVDSETAQPEETPCGARCLVCGETFTKLCASGLFRKHISNFAKIHLHRDPLASGRKL
jgi:hypothetical protein